MLYQNYIKDSSLMFHQEVQLPEKVLMEPHPHTDILWTETVISQMSVWLCVGQGLLLLPFLFLMITYCQFTLIRNQLVVIYLVNLKVTGVAYFLQL